MSFCEVGGIDDWSRSDAGKEFHVDALISSSRPTALTQRDKMDLTVMHIEFDHSVVMLSTSVYQTRPPLLHFLFLNNRYVGQRQQPVT